MLSNEENRVEMVGLLNGFQTYGIRHEGECLNQVVRFQDLVGRSTVPDIIEFYIRVKKLDIVIDKLIDCQDDCGLSEDYNSRITRMLDMANELQVDIELGGP